MPKYYCDYCDTYLTHDSPSVRKTHNSGRKHKDNVRLYYMNWLEREAQNMLDQTTAAYKIGRMPGLLPPMNMMPPPGMMPPMGLPPGMGMFPPMPRGMVPMHIPMQPPLSMATPNPGPTSGPGAPPVATAATQAPV
ncbi:hypothetical protein EMCRGX_G028576 [Ephydatia muelleri]|eukprot:Em0020g75a